MRHSNKLMLSALVLAILIMLYALSRFLYGEASSVNDGHPLARPVEVPRLANQATSNIDIVVENLLPLINMSDSELVLVLLDDDSVEYRRSVAARALGARKSLRGIRVLVDRINYQGSSSQVKRMTTKEDDIERINPLSMPRRETLLSRYPCVEALVDIGWPSLPALVGEYIRISDSPTFQDDIARRRIVDTILLQDNAQHGIGISSIIYLFSKPETRASRSCQKLIFELWADKSGLR